MTSAQESSWPQPRPEDVATFDGMIAAAYQAVSAQPGEERDLDRFRSLFRPDARLFNVTHSEEGGQTAILGLDDFVRGFSGVVTKGVFETEISRRTERFGDIAHLWSTYEVRATAESPDVQARGINSMQLVWDGERWWIVSGMFQNEGPGLPMPEQYGGQGEV